MEMFQGFSGGGGGDGPMRPHQSQCNGNKVCGGEGIVCYLNQESSIFDIPVDNLDPVNHNIPYQHNEVAAVDEAEEDNHLPLVFSTDVRARLRWTPELHARFLDAVNQLGGPQKATPKGIMRIMKIRGLTIYHLKSHLQKFRLGRFPLKEWNEEPIKSNSDSPDLESPATESNSDSCSSSLQANSSLPQSNSSLPQSNSSLPQSDSSLPQSKGPEVTEVKKALEDQTETQQLLAEASLCSKPQVKKRIKKQVGKVLQYRNGSQAKYLGFAMTSACKVLVDQCVQSKGVAADYATVLRKNYASAVADPSLNSIMQPYPPHNFTQASEVHYGLQYQPNYIQFDTTAPFTIDYDMATPFTTEYDMTASYETLFDMATPSALEYDMVVPSATDYHNAGPSTTQSAPTPPEQTAAHSLDDVDTYLNSDADNEIGAMYY